jgi:hypothetical protein
LPLWNTTTRSCAEAASFAPFTRATMASNSWNS